MNLYMPEVETACDIAACFAEARKMSEGEINAPGETSGERRVALITPGRLIMSIPCPSPSAVSEAMIEGVRRIVPPQPKQAITVIAFNDAVTHGALNIQQLNALVPFLGYLMGMAFDGHTVVVFEGHPSALKAGCSDTGVLIVDQRMVDHLQKDWLTVASSATRAPRVLVFGGDGSIAELAPSPGLLDKRPEMRVGDFIRSGQFAAAAGAAATLQRQAAHRSDSSQPIHLELSAAARTGFFHAFYALLGARDAGNVDPSNVGTFNRMVSELQRLMDSQGAGFVSRFNMAYFLANMSQLIPVLVAGEPPEKMVEACGRFGEVADAFQNALERSENATAPNSTLAKSKQDRQGRKPWWKFW